MLLPLLRTLVLATAATATLLPFRGADISSLPTIEATGTTFHDGTKTAPAKPFESIIAAHGANLVRIRVWTAQQYSLQDGLALAKRVVAAGMQVYVDLHYSDTWADPGHQAIPAAWPKNLTGLTSEISTYTKSLVTSFAQQGTPITFIEIGNEINDGLLWPVGQISVNGYGPPSQLLHAAAAAVHAGSPSTRVLIHLANGWDATSIHSWFDGIFGAKVSAPLTRADVDVMGFSFYPFYGTGATISALSSSLSGVVQTYGKDVIVVETDWPESCPPNAANPVTLSEPSIPVSVAGQQTWVSDIAHTVSGLGAHGLGVVYWEPGWVGSAALGSGCADNLLVDSTGTTRASINIFSADM